MKSRANIPQPDQRLPSFAINPEKNVSSSWFSLSTLGVGNRAATEHVVDFSLLELDFNFNLSVWRICSVSCLPAAR